MKKTVFIGDIHGDLEFVQFVDKQYEGWDKIFVGDYLDSWYFHPKMCIESLKHILMMCSRGDTRALLGNHELSYLFEGNRCSGWNSNTEILLIPLRSKTFQTLEYYIWIPEHKILVTHGGITQPLWRDSELTIENLVPTLDEWKKQDIRASKFGWIGKSRGGIDPYGGPFWCDFDDEFQPVFGITQIFGHTPARNIRRVGSSYCINQIEMMAVREVLEFENGAFNVAQFKVEIEKTEKKGKWTTDYSPKFQEALKNVQNKIDSGM